MEVTWRRHGTGDTDEWGPSEQTLQFLLPLRPPTERFCVKDTAECQDADSL